MNGREVDELDPVECTVVIGGAGSSEQFAFQGKGKVVRCGPQGVRRKAKPKPTAPLVKRAVEVLLLGGLRPGQIVELLSGVHSIKERTLFNVRKAIRNEREVIRRAREEKERLVREAKEARAEAERRQVETIAAASRAYKRGL